MVALSIIVPTFKRVDQTIETIKLLFSSNGYNRDFEMQVIVADSSPDVLLKTALEKNFASRITYTCPTKPGVATNKNQGARLAKHPIMIFCDSDMEVEADTLLNAIKALQNHPTAAMVGGQVIWKNGTHDGAVDRPRAEDRIESRNGTQYIEALYSRFIATYTEVFRKVGGYDEQVFNMRGEGSDLAIRYWRAGFPLVYDAAIRVHHVHDAPDSVALRINHPEWGIAKDLVLLGYKYDMFGVQYPNFQATITKNFQHLGAEGYYRIIEGIGTYLDLVTEVKPALDQFRKQDKARFDFKFLEVFSDKTMLATCISQSENALAQIRKQCF